MVANSDIIYDDDDEYITSDRYFRYEDCDGKVTRFKVYSVKYAGRPMVHKDAFYELYTKRGNVRFITCLCGSNDWNENGRFINEYECNGCGQFIEVTKDDIMQEVGVRNDKIVCAKRQCKHVHYENDRVPVSHPEFPDFAFIKTCPKCGADKFSIIEKSRENNNEQ